MTDTIDIVVREQGIDQVAQSFDTLAASARRVHTDVAALQKLLGSVGRSTAAANRITGLGAAAQGATGHVANLNAAMGALNANRVTANLNSANAALGRTGAAANAAAIGMRGLAGAFIGFQTVKGVVGALVEAQIAMQQIHYGLLAATGSAQKANSEFEYLQKNAATLGLDLKTSAMEYTRLAASASAMNVAVEDQRKLYTALSQASTVLHLDQQKVQFATLALTQMFSKGKIQAEELRRQLGEAIPGANVRFQKAVMEIVKGTNLAKYSFEDLMKRGLLNTKQFLPQLIQALSETGRGWEEAAGGLNAEINRMKTAWFELKAELSEGLFSQATVAIVRFLSANMKEMAGAVAALGVSLALAFAPAAIVAFIGYMRTLAALVWATAGPWGVLAAAIAAVVTYVVTLRDQIKLTADGTATLGDFMVAAWSDVSRILDVVGGTLWEMIRILGQVLGYASNTFATMTGLTKQYGEVTKSVFGDIAESNDATWLKILKATARTIDAILGLLLGLHHASRLVFTAISDFIVTTFSNSVEILKAIFSGEFDKALEIGQAQFSNLKNTGVNLGKALSEGFNTGFGAMAEEGVEQWINKTQQQAEASAKAAKQAKLLADTVWNDGSLPAKDPAAPGKPGKPDTKKQKEIEQLRDQLAQLIGKIDPTQNALKELAKAQETLNAAVKNGDPVMAAMIAKMGGTEAIMARLTEKYKDALNPVGALNDTYDRELKSIQAITPEQKALALAQEASNKSRKDGYDATVQATMAETTYRRELEKTRAQLLANAEGQLNQNVAAEKAMEIAAMAQATKDSTPAEKSVKMSQAAGTRVDPIMLAQSNIELAQSTLTDLQDYYLEQEALAQGNADRLIAINAMKNEAITAQEQAVADAKTAMLVAQLDRAGQIQDLGFAMMQSNNVKVFKAGKALALAGAVVKGVSAAISSFDNGGGYPWGLIPMALSIATTAAQISQIRAQQLPSYRTGGEMVVGGSGGTDSQLVQFNATPGERVTINTPHEARAMERVANNMETNNSRGDVNVNLTVLQTGRADNKTPEQMARQVRIQAMKFAEV